MLYRFIKRLEDILFSLIIMIVFYPILFIVAIILVIYEGFPIFYISKRMVNKNKEIRIFKFRTMIKDAKDEKYQLEKRYMKDGYLDIPLNSEVYTKVGLFLEKTQFVELPQLIPILFGYLSFVGNRPLPKDNIKILMKKFPDNWHKRFDSPAGLTGISQVVGKFNLSPEQRLELESLYSEVYRKGNILKADAYIFLSTILFLLFNNVGAYRSFKSAKSMLISCLKK